MVAGPLQGVRILDLTHVWAGPLSVRFLADWGAHVVKVEAPYGRGPREFPSDPIGGWMSGEPGAEPWNANAIFNKLHRNRRSLCLDLKAQEGKNILLELVKEADVVIENFSARAMPSMGLGYEELKHANEGIIYVSMPGYGNSGPYKDRVAFGPTVEPMSGFTNMLGYAPDDLRNSAIAMLDPISGTHAAAAMVEGLRYREETGHGCAINMSLHEGGVSFNGPWLVQAQLSDVPECIGNRHPQMSPHGVYPCAGSDGWVAVACADESQWRALAGLIQADPNMVLADRRSNTDEIDLLIARWTQKYDKTRATQILQSAGVSAGSVNGTDNMLEDAQVQARGFFNFREAFDVPMPGNPVHMAGCDESNWQPCPRLGEHNGQILRQWLGMNDEQVRDLAQRAVIHDKPPG